MRSSRPAPPRGTRPGQRFRCEPERQDRGASTRQLRGGLRRVRGHVVRPSARHIGGEGSVPLGSRPPHVSSNADTTHGASRFLKVFRDTPEGRRHRVTQYLFERFHADLERAVVGSTADFSPAFAPSVTHSATFLCAAIVRGVPPFSKCEDAAGAESQHALRPFDEQVESEPRQC